MNEPLDTKLVEQSIELLHLDNYFTHKEMSDMVAKALRVCAPLDFFLQPASMSGKYHPHGELGVGGLVRHTKAVMMVALSLFKLEDFSAWEEDCIMAAIVLHDIAKPSKTHPIEVKPLLEPIMDEYYSELSEIIPLIESHMGQWNYFGKLPVPETKMQKFVHLCDYVASRKFINIDVSQEDSQ